MRAINKRDVIQASVGLDDVETFLTWKKYIFLFIPISSSLLNSWFMLGFEYVSIEVHRQISNYVYLASHFSIMIQFLINVIWVMKLNVYCAVHHLECRPIYYVAVNAWLFTNWYKWNDLLMQYARNHKYTNVHLLSASVCVDLLSDP